MKTKHSFTQYLPAYLLQTFKNNKPIHLTHLLKLTAFIPSQSLPQFTTLSLRQWSKTSLNYKSFSKFKYSSAWLRRRGAGGVGGREHFRRKRRGRRHFSPRPSKPVRHLTSRAPFTCLQPCQCRPGYISTIASQIFDRSGRV